MWIALIKSLQQRLTLTLYGVAMKQISTFLGLLKKIFDTDLLRILENSMHDIFTTQK